MPSDDDERRRQQPRPETAPVVRTIEALPPDRAAAWDEAERTSRRTEMMRRLEALDVRGEVAKAAAAEAAAAGADGGAAPGDIVNVVTYESSSAGGEDDDDGTEDPFGGESLSFIATDDGSLSSTAKSLGEVHGSDEDDDLSNTLEDNRMGGGGVGARVRVGVGVGVKTGSGGSLRDLRLRPTADGRGGGRSAPPPRPFEGTMTGGDDIVDDEDDSIAQLVESALSLSPPPVMPLSMRGSASSAAGGAPSSATAAAVVAEGPPAEGPRNDGAAAGRVAADVVGPKGASSSVPAASTMIITDLRSPPAVARYNGAAAAAPPPARATTSTSKEEEAPPPSTAKPSHHQLHAINQSACDSSVLTDLRSVSHVHGNDSLVVTDLVSPLPCTEEEPRQDFAPRTATNLDDDDDDDDRATTDRRRLPPLPPKDGVTRSALASKGFDPISSSVPGAAAPSETTMATSAGGGMDEAMSWLVGSSNPKVPPPPQRTQSKFKKSDILHLEPPAHVDSVASETDTPLTNNTSLEGAGLSRAAIEAISLASKASPSGEEENTTVAEPPTAQQPPLGGMPSAADECFTYSQADDSTPALLSAPPPPVEQNESLAAATIRSLEMQLAHVRTQNRALQNRAGQDRVLMETLSAGRADAEEELELVKAQWREFLGTHHPEALREGLEAEAEEARRRGGEAAVPPLATTLEGLRGELLQRGREELAALGDETARLRAALEDAHRDASTKENALTSENDALKEEVRALSDRLAQRGAVENDALRRLERLDETSRRTEEHLAAKASAAEATAGELRRQLEEIRSKAEEEAERAVKAERERDEWRGRAEAAERDRDGAEEELRAAVRDRDALKGELTELVRSRDNPQRTMERDFASEIDRLTREAERARADARRRVDAAESLDKDRREKLDRAKRGEAKALANAESARKELGTLKRLIRSLDRSGALGSVGAEDILGGAANLEDEAEEEESGDGGAMPTSGSSGPSKAALSTAFTQTDALNEEIDSSSAAAAPPASTSVGINTSVTASFATELYAEGLQARTALHASEMRTSQLQIENANLRGRCEHLEGQARRLEARLSKFGTGGPEDILSPRTKERVEGAEALERTCEELRCANAALEQELSSSVDARTFVEEENKKAMERCVSLEVLAEEATAECERLTREMADLGKELSERKNGGNDQEEVGRLEEEARRASEERDAALSECQQLSSQLRSVQSEVVDFQAKCEEMKRALEVHEQEKKFIQTEKMRLEGQVKELVGLRTSNALLAEQNSALEQSMADKEAQRQTLEKRALALISVKKGQDVSTMASAEVRTRLDEELSSFEARGDLADESDRLRVEDQLRSVKEKLSLYEFSLVVGEEKADELLSEKAQLEQKLENVRSELSEKSKAVEETEVERTTLRDRVKALTAQVDQCHGKIQAFQEELHSVLSEKRHLEESLTLSLKEKESLSVKVDQLKNERAAIQSNGNALERDLLSTRDRLAAVAKDKAALELQLQASEKEWRNVCVQAESLVQTVELQNACTQTGGDHASESPMRGRESSDKRENGTPDATLKMTPSIIKQILTEVRSSFEAATIEREEALARSRLFADKELKKLRLSLDAAEEEVRLLRNRNATLSAGCNTAPKLGRIDEERLLRIRVAKEQASLSAAHHKQLALIGSKKKGMRSESNDCHRLDHCRGEAASGEQLAEADCMEQSLVSLQKHEAEKTLRGTTHFSGTQFVRKDRNGERSTMLDLLQSERRDPKSLLALNGTTESHYMAPTPGGAKKIVFVPTPTVASSKQSGNDSFRETEKLVMDVLNSCNKS